MACDVAHPGLCQHHRLALDRRTKRAGIGSRPAVLRSRGAIFSGEAHAYHPEGTGEWNQPLKLQQRDALPQSSTGSDGRRATPTCSTPMGQSRAAAEALP